MDYNNNYDFMEYESSIVEDWPIKLQNLIDKRIIKVSYDKLNKAYFSLTFVGKNLLKEIDLKLN